MTTTPTPDAQESWGTIALRFAGQMALVNAGQHIETLTKSDLTDLRRMSLDDPAPATLLLMDNEGMLAQWAQDEAIFHKWILILHGLALMTPRFSGNRSLSAHDGGTPVGKALFQAGYSETRLNRLLTAREETLHTLLSRMFRVMAAANQRFSWREMVRLIRSSDYDEIQAEQQRQRIASDYYRAMRQSSQ